MTHVRYCQLHISLLYYFPFKISSNQCFYIRSKQASIYLYTDSMSQALRWHTELNAMIRWTHLKTKAHLKIHTHTEMPVAQSGNGMQALVTFCWENLMFSPAIFVLWDLSTGSDKQTPNKWLTKCFLSSFPGDWINLKPYFLFSIMHCELLF